MHDVQFASAICPAPFSVLGLPLRPYSLGHELLLLGRSNPLLDKSWDEFTVLSTFEQVRAIKNAVWICCNDWRHNQSEALARVKLWIWEKRVRKANYALAIAEFRNYLVSGRSLPPAPGSDARKVLYPKDDFKGRRLGSPFLAQLYMFCTSEQFKEQRKGYKTVWDVPYALAGHFYFTFLELQGQLRIENEQEREEQEQFDKLESEAREEASKRNGEPAPLPPMGLATPPPNLDGPPPMPPEFRSQMPNGGDPTMTSTP